ncbi:hypothetical protein VP01_761g3 [Puccinia sorghi]|uniref:Uncharacterized protein n=1 Tax=Puccinia sorghi TaxID=27349 RepID=A0A0L6UCR0_9BASI|nr:hypothetical protein VP01_761g3 [Puccinia sorghi]
MIWLGVPVAHPLCIIRPNRYLSKATAEGGLTHKAYTLLESVVHILFQLELQKKSQEKFSATITISLTEEDLENTTPNLEKTSHCWSKNETLINSSSTLFVCFKKQRKWEKKGIVYKKILFLQYSWFQGQFVHASDVRPPFSNVADPYDCLIWRINYNMISVFFKRWKANYGIMHHVKIIERWIHLHFLFFSFFFFLARKQYFHIIHEQLLAMPTTHWDASHIIYEMMCPFEASFCLNSFLFIPPSTLGLVHDIDEPCVRLGPNNKLVVYNQLSNPFLERRRSFWEKIPNQTGWILFHNKYAGRLETKHLLNCNHRLENNGKKEHKKQLRIKKWYHSLRQRRKHAWRERLWQGWKDNILPLLPFRFEIVCWLIRLSCTKSFSTSIKVSRFNFEFPESSLSELKVELISSGMDQVLSMQFIFI